MFVPENLLREAKRQRSILTGTVPSICVLDPDGDIVENLLARNQARPNEVWACYHTRMHNFELDEIALGIIAYTVGAPFAVLVAEELFASRCKLLINITSSGQIAPKGKPPYFVLIEKALRDEGTSYHYLPPSDFSAIDDELLGLLDGAFSELPEPVYRGTTWTTDAPFRETEHAINYAKNLDVVAVEIELDPDGWTGIGTCVKGGEKPDQRAEQNTATAAFGVRWSEGVGMRPGAVSAGNEGRA